MSSTIIYKEESYKIIGVCMEIHNNLGSGFLEIVYKDALEYEFRKADIQYEREKEYEVIYKDIILPHKFYADFVVFDDDIDIRLRVFELVFEGFQIVPQNIHVTVSDPTSEAPGI